MAIPKINLPKTSGANTKPAVGNPFACEPRKHPAAGPKDITLTLFNYLPLDREYTTKWVGKNIFGMRVHTKKLESGNVYEAYDGKRLILEVGCDTITYLNIKPNTPSHHKFYLQASSGFFFDITDRLVAAQVVKKTAMVEKIAKYEMYFLMGLFSTVSIPMWLAVTGTDVTYMFIVNKNKVLAFKELSSVITKELDNIHIFAPTLHVKLIKLINNEKLNNAKQAAKNLPKKVVSSEKVQAQTAGILYGKYAISAKGLTVWTALSTVLVQAFVKALTNSVDAYIDSIDSRYAGIIRDLRNVDWEKDDELRIASQKIVTLFNEAKVQLSVDEAIKIFTEVRNNRLKLEKSIVNIHTAFINFKKKIK